MPSARRTKSRALTPKQLALLTYLRDYERERGYAPTLQELADHFGVSKITIFEHVGVLRGKGFLRQHRYRARSLKLTPQVEFPDERPTRMPLLGRIAAGLPIEAVQDSETLDLEEVLATRGKTFALRVRGDSMIEEHIRDGDYVIVERRDTARDGETVVALLDNGEATLKKLYREADRVRLQPANAGLAPIYAKQVKIQGVVVGLVRKV
jgi:repressor LexA